ncbi:hypothetical protein HDU97_007465 [Phlyctochytrium planicorne]|nr:hypothetical protein HDU97_007465 [Phlyctochytrium planicorne]
MSASLPPSIDPQSQIYKVPLEPTGVVSSKMISWGKGSNAKFHFQVYAYVSPEVEAAADEEIVKLKKDHQEGHAHKHDHKHDKHDPKKRGEELQKRAKAFEEMLAQLKNNKPGNEKEKAKAKALEEKKAAEGAAAAAEASANTKTPAQKPVRRKISDSRNFDEKPFEMRCGLGFSVPAMEKCIKTMKIGERARFLCLPEECEGYAQLESVLRQEKKNKELIAKGLPPQKMFGCCAHATAEDAEANKDLLLLVGSPLEFEIELVSVQEPGDFTKEIWEMSSAEKFEEAPTRKDEGSALYRQGDIDGACEKYTRALMLLESLSLSSEVTGALRSKKQAEDALKKDEKKRLDEILRLKKQGLSIPDDLKEEAAKIPEQPADEAFAEKVMDLMNTTRLNYAACKLKQGDLPTVVAQCSEVLKNDPNSIKALFRRAQAYNRIGRDLDLAEKDVKSIRRILTEKELPETSPEWVELKREEKVLEKLLKANKEKEKKMFGKMFA